MAEGLFKWSSQRKSFHRNLWTSSTQKLLHEKLNSTVASPSTIVERTFSGSILSSFETVSEQYVKGVCLKAALKTRKLDPVPSALLRDCFDVLLPHVTHVTNDSLSSGSFPTVIKSAIVRPLLKMLSLDSNCLKNY